MTPGISSLTTSPGATSTKSTARGSCLVPRATASSCAPLHLCGTSGPRRLAKNVESARQRYVPLFACPWFALKKYAFLFYQSVLELGLRVPVAPRAIIFVNMHPRPHPIPPLQMPPSPPPSRLVVPRAARPGKDQRYWRNITRVRARPPPGNHPGLIIVLSSRQRCPSSSHSTTTPTTRVHHTGRAPRRAMTVRWRSRGNSTTTRAYFRIPRTIRIPLQDSGHHRSLPRIRSVAFLTVTTPGLSR
jgi:hypothetical protein